MWLAVQPGNYSPPDGLPCWARLALPELGLCDSQAALYLDAVTEITRGRAPTHVSLLHRWQVGNIAGEHPAQEEDHRNVDDHL